MVSTLTGAHEYRDCVPQPATRSTRIVSAARSRKWLGAAGVSFNDGGASSRGGSPFAIDNPTLGEVVGRDLDGHPVARDDPDTVLPHLAGDVRQDAMPVLKLDHELCVGERFDYAPFRANRFLFGHADLLNRPAP